MRETARDYDPITRCFRFSLSFFRLVFNSLSAMCKCDSVLISAVFKCAETREASRIYAMCTIIISDNYLVFLEPHALSVLKARTELYARRGVGSILSLIWYVRINFFWIVRQDVAIVTLYVLDSSLGCFIYTFFSPFSLTMMRDLNCYSNSTSTQS